MWCGYWPISKLHIDVMPPPIPMVKSAMKSICRIIYMVHMLLKTMQSNLSFLVRVSPRTRSVMCLFSIHVSSCIGSPLLHQAHQCLRWRRSCYCSLNVTWLSPFFFIPRYLRHGQASRLPIASPFSSQTPWQPMDSSWSSSSLLQW